MISADKRHRYSSWEYTGELRYHLITNVPFGKDTSVPTVVILIRPEGAHHLSVYLNLC